MQYEDYDYELIRKAVCQIGVLCVAAGVAQGFIDLGSWPAMAGLTTIGVVLILGSGLRITL